MAVFNDFELTNAGINLLGQVSAGQPLIFTKIKLGDGNFIGNVKYLTDLFSTFKEVGISDIVIQEDSSINIKSEFSNDGFSTSKEWKEIGIFAKAGESGTEVLYSYSYSLLTVETIPDKTIPYRRDLNFRNYISDATNVTYDITIQKDKYDFDSDVAMQSASYLAEGDRANVWKDDSCQKRRVAVVNDNGILLNNGLYANLILDIQGKYDSSIALTNKTIVGAINELNETKEPKIIKKSGFNLDITDRKDLNDSNKVVSAKALMEVNALTEKKQDKTDNTLNTMAKEIVPSINEIEEIKADKDLVKQLPNSNIYGAIWGENGRLKANGILKNIHGLKTATIDEYGIIAGDGLSCIVQEGYNGIYCGRSFNYNDTLMDDTLPKIPVGYTFPGGQISFDNANELNFDGYSYIMNGVKAKTTTFPYLLNIGDKRLYTNLYSDNLGQYDSFVFSSLYGANYLKNGDKNTLPVRDYAQVDRPTLFLAGGRGESFNQFVVYKGSLTQLELETEKDKNLFFEGAVDINSLIENNQKISAILGSTPKGNIQENKETTVVGDVWYDTASNKYYECNVGTSDNFIDLNKWSEKSISELKKEIDDLFTPTVLFTGEIVALGKITLSENWDNYKRILFVGYGSVDVNIQHSVIFTDYITPSDSTSSNNPVECRVYNVKDNSYVNCVFRDTNRNELYINEIERGAITKVIGYKH